MDLNQRKPKVSNTFIGIYLLTNEENAYQKKDPAFSTSVSGQPEFLPTEE